MGANLHVSEGWGTRWLECCDSLESAQREIELNVANSFFFFLASSSSFSIFFCAARPEKLSNWATWRARLPPPSWRQSASQFTLNELVSCVRQWSSSELAAGWPLEWGRNFQEHRGRRPAASEKVRACGGERARARELKKSRRVNSST